MSESLRAKAAAASRMAVPTVGASAYAATNADRIKVSANVKFSDIHFEVTPEMERKIDEDYNLILQKLAK